MQPRLIKSSNMGEFVQSVWTGKNESGYEPIDEIVLVLPDGAAAQTSGGIHITPEMQARMSLSAETGVIVAMAEGAFRWNRDRTRPMAGYRPQPGDRVYMKRFAGQVMLGEDQRLYRACSDVEIAAVKRASINVMESLYGPDAVAEARRKAPV
jgi:co-chaperonin GroES (HSP10)